jgi:hypothetical protein
MAAFEGAALVKSSSRAVLIFILVAVVLGNLLYLWIQSQKDVAKSTSTNKAWVLPHFYVLDHLERIFQLHRVAGPLLAYRKWRRVLKVRAPDLDDVHPLSRLRPDGIFQSGNGRNQAIADFENRRDVHRGVSFDD